MKIFLIEYIYFCYYVGVGRFTLGNVVNKKGRIVYCN